MQLTKLNLGLTVALGWLLVIALDAHFRLYVGQQDVDINGVGLQTQVTKAKLLTEKHANLISAQYDKYAKEDIASLDTDAKKLPGMSESEQALQQGRLDKLFIGNDMYQLKGIFGEPEYFAVLSKTDIATGALEEIKLTKADQLGGYTVSELAKGHIQLSLNERNIQLVMFN